MVDTNSRIEIQTHTRIPVYRLLRLLDSIDPELGEHGRRTARLARDIATEMALPDDEIDQLHVGAQLHDIGKLFISRSILDQPGPLTDEQWVELRHHPRMGYELVRDRVPDAVSHMVLNHHERYDGTGYPNAVSGSSLRLEARILQVADAFDAITSTRPYQPALPFEYAVSEMVRCSGTQFDPGVVEAIVSLASRYEWRAVRFPMFADLVAEVAV